MALNFITFNQDNSLIAAGTARGFRIYYTDPFSRCFESHEGDVAIVEMLFSTSLVAVTLSPRLLRIQNTKKRSTICELTFPTMVLAVRLNRKRLAVVLEDQIYLYDISNMDLLKIIETAPNPNAICALSPSSDNNYLTYPVLKRVASSPTYELPAHTPPTSNRAGQSTGDVMLFDATRKEAVNLIEAHSSPLSHVSLNNIGTLLATSSEKGTIVRVFSVPGAQKLYQFRRGSIPSRIYSMSFNGTSTLLSVASSTETVHIFRLADQSGRPLSQKSSSPTSPAFSPSHERGSSIGSENGGDSRFSGYSAEPTPGPREQRNPTFMSMLRRTSQNVGSSVAATVGGYLPNAVAEIWEPSRDFAWVKVPRTASGSASSVKTVVAMSNNGPQIMAVTSEGTFYVFNVDLEKGGEGTLVKQYSIMETSERLVRSTVDAGDR